VTAPRSSGVVHAIRIYLPLSAYDLPPHPVTIPDLGCYRAAMASPAQIAANRLNAIKSTGPRTLEGKTASRMNALRHGIDARLSVLPGEDPDALETLAAQYRDEYQPAGAEQTFLVETLIQSDWNRRRYARIQAELTTRLLADMDPADRSIAALFMPDNPAARALNRVIRHYEAAQNAWFRAFKELQRIQKRDAETLPAPPTSENWLRSDNSPTDPQIPPPAPAPTLESAAVKNCLSSALSSTPSPHQILGASASRR
jgi:hypothetical protein